MHMVCCSLTSNQYLSRSFGNWRGWAASVEADVSANTNQSAGEELQGQCNKFPFLLTNAVTLLRYLLSFPYGVLAVSIFPHLVRFAQCLLILLLC